MMRLFIPRLGTRLELQQNWTFQLHPESRNETLWNLLFPGVNMWVRRNWCDTYKTKERPKTATLPKGTVLRMERIYVRLGQGDFDSVSFRILKGGFPPDPKASARFWVKLADANNILFDTVL